MKTSAYILVAAFALVLSCAGAGGREVAPDLFPLDDRSAAPAETTRERPCQPTERQRLTQGTQGMVLCCCVESGGGNCCNYVEGSLCPAHVPGCGC